jgi:hypothetical protein
VILGFVNTLLSLNLCFLLAMFRFVAVVAPLELYLFRCYPRFDGVLFRFIFALEVLPLLPNPHELSCFLREIQPR